MVKNLPANARDKGLNPGTGRSPGQEDPLEKETATDSSILAREIPWTEEPGGLHTVHWGTKESDTSERLNGESVFRNTHTHSVSSTSEAHVPLPHRRRNKTGS